MKFATASRNYMNVDEQNTDECMPSLPLDCMWLKILKKRMKLLPECDTIKKVFDGKNGGT